MNVEELVKQAAEKIKDDPSLVMKFVQKPGETAEQVLGVDLPEDQIDAFVDGIKKQFMGEDGKLDLGDVVKDLGSFLK